MLRKRWVILKWGAAVTSILGPIAAQEVSPPSQAQQRAAIMNHLVEQLRVQTREDAARYTKEFRDQITDQARRLVKEQVLEKLAESNGDAAVVAESLKPLGQKGWDRDTGAPFAFAGMIYGDPVLITGFQFVRGPSGAPDIKAFIQAYRKVAGSWEFIAEAGDDLDGYVLCLADLNSPRANEMWLLAHGVKTGSNILSRRMRVYAFDGEKFTTLLSPPDRPYGEVKIQGNEIVVKSVDYEANKWIRTERYLISINGIVLTSSTLGLE